MMLFVIGLIFFATILIGVPIAFGMGLAGASWILFFEGMEPTILVRRFYYALNAFPLLAILADYPIRVASSCLVRLHRLGLVRR